MDTPSTSNTLQHEGMTTIIYIDDLEEKIQQNIIMLSFFWLLKIIMQHFFDRKETLRKETLRARFSFVNQL